MSFMENPVDAKSPDPTRRSSSRSIKRRKFDDELVESSLGSQVSSALIRARGRTQSAPLLESTFSSSSIHSPFAFPASLDPSVSRIKRTVAKLNTQFIHANPGAAGSRRVKKVNKHNVAAGSKDFGRWKPVDDFALILGVLQTCDLRSVYQGVKFTCKFTFNEIAQRWYALLYDRTVSRVALSAVRNLHPETVASVEARALFSEAEENLLATIKSNTDVKPQVFKELLQNNPQLFYKGRTLKSLHTHWLLMKQYNLLSDQTNEQSFSFPPLTSTEDRNNTILSNIGTPADTIGPCGEPIPTYQEYEELLSNPDTFREVTDSVVDKQIALSDRIMRKEIRMLEDELAQLQRVASPITGITSSEFDNQTLAALRGKYVRFLMRSKEITLGRETVDNHVDIDLSLEGPAYKVSRKQATIRVKNNGEFYVASQGKRPIYVDGNAILPGSKCKLKNDSVLEVASLKFIFMINHELIEVIKAEAAKMNLQK